MRPCVKAIYDPRTYTLTFVVHDPKTKDAVVVDPVLDFDPASGRTWTESADKVSRFIDAEGLKLRYILETHAHADHLTGAQILRRRYDAPVVIGAPIRSVQQTFQGVFGLGDALKTDGSQFDRLLGDGDSLPAGSLTVEAIATPGHTPACMTYKIGDAIFTGDALFMDDYGTGRCDFPGGSAEDLFDSIQKLYRLPDETRVFVGHDYQPGGRDLRWETTIGASKASNPQLRGETTKENFVKLRQARDKTLAAPRLLFPSVQVNVDAGRLPRPIHGVSFLRVPLNPFTPADELGEPLDKT